MTVYHQTVIILIDLFLHFFKFFLILDFVLETIQQNVAHQWIQSKREEIIDQMTEACLNQSLDALLSRFLLMKEDYELISTKPTRTSKVRQLLDTSDSQGEEFAQNMSGMNSVLYLK